MFFDFSFARLARVKILNNLIMNMRIRSGTQKNWALALRRCDVFPLDINLVYIESIQPGNF